MPVFISGWTDPLIFSQLQLHETWNDQDQPKVIKCLVFQITPSCIRPPERLFSAFRKKEEEWVFLFEWKRNKEEESKQQVVGRRGMIGCLLHIIQTSVSWIKDKKFGVWAGELRCCSSFFGEVTRVRQVKCTRECDGPAGFHSSVSSQPAECCHRGIHRRHVTAPE